MEPYYNKNIDIYMTSYVVPLYKEEELIGIVGMDIDFSLIDDQVREIKAFDTGYAFLLSSEGDLYSHPLLDGNGSEPEPARSLDQYKTFIQENEASDELITYPYLGENKMLAFSTLRNGMKLLLTVPEKEIAPYEHILELEVPLTDGSKMHVTDYASAGKLWTEESKMAAWMLIK
jgi:hypothetical protein